MYLFRVSVVCLCDVRQRFLLRDVHLSRGILQSVVSLTFMLS